MEKWTTELIGSHIGKTALITQGCEGIGLEVARELARHGMRVIICAEDVMLGESALRDIRSSMYGAVVIFEPVNLNDLESVKHLANKILAEYDQLDLLINNADFMAPALKANSVQGHELVFAKNYLSHFSLTARLFPILLAAADGRIIFQSSQEHHKGVIDFFDLNGALYYEPHKAYTQSKLALLTFAKELDRRLRLTQIDLKSIPVHVGGFHTPFISKFLNYALGHTPIQGALPILFAATSQDARGGHYYGPDGFKGAWGDPTELECADLAKNLQVASKLWEVSEGITGLDFSVRDFRNVLPFQNRDHFQPGHFI
jgi:NAD(P)-dependent dehydrogenase (short-subunit alcohol dehydrogenase family)